MQIVTLTTDFGDQDYYAAALKGAMLSVNPALCFIDITHNIKNYNISQAAYSLRYSYRNFPEGTIHVISVNNYYSPEAKYLALKHRGHYFIGPDNGVFSLLFDEIPTERYVLSEDFKDINSYKRCFANAVGHIANGKPFEEIGTFSEIFEQRFSLQAIANESQIRGSVIHVDNYGNVILNITKDLWERFAHFRRFTLFYKRNEPINDLSETYSDVAIGETTCLFNAANHLEIAINMGQASSLLSMDIDDAVVIEFY